MIVVVEWGRVYEILLASDYILIAPALVLVLVHYCLRSLRWKFLLPESDALRFRSMFDGIMVGNFASYFLPLRAGEFIRPFILARSGSHSFSSAFASVVIERFFDLSAVLLSFGVVLLLVPGIPSYVHHGAAGLSVLAVLILLFIVVGIFFPDFAKAGAEIGLKFMPSKFRQPLRKFLHEFIAGTSVLKDPRRLLAVICLTALVWLSCYLFFLIFMWITKVPVSGFLDGMLIGTTVSVVVALAVAAPSSPGFVGVYQAGCAVGFALFHIDSAIAVSYAILSHVFQYVLFTTYGVYFLAHSKMKFGDLRRVAVEHK